MNFREKYMAGETDFDEIFDLTDQWNFSDDPRTLREFLGLTTEEEDVWISESDEALELLLKKEKNRKIFFTDLDGTLLNDKKEITPRNRKAVEQLLKAGHVIAISTGRALQSALIQAENLGLTEKNCYIICYNGAQIYDIERKKLLCRKTLPMECVRFAFDEAKKFGIDIQTYSDTHVIAEKDNPNIRRYAALQGLDYLITDDVTQALPCEPPKMLALDFDDSDRVLAFQHYFSERCDGKINLCLSDPALLELTPPEVSKGMAVRFLCEYLGIPLINSVAAGDAENDLSMIQAAHVGAAMCNGINTLKEHADYITEADNNHDGIAEILEKFVLG